MSRLLDEQAVVKTMSKWLGYRTDAEQYPLRELLSRLPSAQPETYKEKLNEIASALSEKFAYMNTCLNERDIILGYLGVKRSCETHCNTNCTNTKCESHPLFTQPERKHGHWVHRGCGVFECDQCGKLVSTNVYKSEKVSDSFKFCPECGLEMRGEQNV